MSVENWGEEGQDGLSWVGWLRPSLLMMASEEVVSPSQASMRKTSKCKIISDQIPKFSPLGLNERNSLRMQRLLPLFVFDTFPTWFAPEGFDPGSLDKHALSQLEEWLDSQETDGARLIVNGLRPHNMRKQAMGSYPADERGSRPCFWTARLMNIKLACIESVTLAYWDAHPMQCYNCPNSNNSRLSLTRHTWSFAFLDVFSASGADWQVHHDDVQTTGDGGFLLGAADPSQRRDGVCF